MALSEATRKQIATLVSENKVVLFMKGSRQAPQCGFSAKVVQILDQFLPAYQTFDVLSSPEIREGIKEFSKWPTIPQLYIDGQLIGGSDIVTELNASGELRGLLSESVSEPALPTLRVSEKAAKALASFLTDAAGDSLHLKIDAQFENDLFLGPREPSDIEILVGGLALLVDRASAARADGLSIDFVDGDNGGFKIENPNQPPTVKQLSAPELKAMLDRGEVILFDVRPEAERALASIAQARSLSAAGKEYLLGLDRATAVAFQCHHGMRSQNAAEEVLREGFRSVYNLKGGIEAWSQLVDPSVPRY